MDTEPTNNDTAQRREDVRQWVRQLRAFYVHATLYVAVSVMLVLINLVINANADRLGEWGAWWSMWSVLGWGIGIAVHGLVVLLARHNLFGDDWEARKVDELLARDQ